MMGETPYEKLLSKQTDTDPEFAEALAKNRSNLYTSLAVSQPIGDGMEVVAWRQECRDGDFIFFGGDPTSTHGAADPLVLLSDAQALIAAKDARIEELEAAIDAEEKPHGMPWRFWSGKAQEMAAKRIAAEARAEAAEAQVKRLTEDNEAACKDLRGFLTSFVREHFPDNTGWKPLPDLMGMLTQMDNASTIARDYKARIKALEGALEPFAKAADIKLCGEWRDDEWFGQTDVSFFLTFGDLRAARSTLKPSENADGQ